MEWMFKAGTKSKRYRDMSLWNNRYSGRPVLGGITKKGYLRFGIGNKNFMAHRVAFAIINGRFPEIVDHINGDRLDNRIHNLREADKFGNARNASPRKGSSSKFKGVIKVKATGRWQARIRKGGKMTVIGTFNSEKEAAHAYDEMAMKIFGEFAWINFPANP